MSNEQEKQQPQQIVLDPMVPAHAIEIIDQMLQPGARMDRQAWGMAEVCVMTIRRELSKPVTS